MDAFTPVKLEFNGCLRRIRLQSHTITALKREIVNLEPSLLHYTLSYLDDEGDRVCLITDGDLLEALSLFRERNNTVLKVLVEITEPVSAVHESASTMVDGEASRPVPTTEATDRTDLVTVSSSIECGDDDAERKAEVGYPVVRTLSQ
jgi:hypothetical protein